MQFQQLVSYRAGDPSFSSVFEQLTTCLFKWVFGGLCIVQVYIEEEKYIAFSNTVVKKVASTYRV